MDYSVITKPPLHVWLTALSFAAFGINAISLRLVPVISAWVTVLVIMLWARRIAGPVVALAAGLVLSTTFGFLYVHSGRTGNTDALFALLIALTALTLHHAIGRPWMRLWLGPLLAALFLLRGPGVLTPLASSCWSNSGIVPRAHAGRRSPPPCRSSRVPWVFGWPRGGALMKRGYSSSCGTSTSSPAR